MSRLDVLENDFWNAINSSPPEAERIDSQPWHGDATEWCEKTATEIYATSALPYPFPVDSEIYDH